MRLPGLGGSPPALPAPPPPVDRNADQVAARKKEERMAELKRRGRAASILTGPESSLGSPNVTRPTANKLG